MLMGILRGTLLGPIRSWRMLFGSPYGWTYIAALVLMGALISRGAGARTRIPTRVWDGDAYRRRAPPARRSRGHARPCKPKICHPEAGRAGAAHRA